MVTPHAARGDGLQAVAWALEAIFAAIRATVAR
jgi:hypothetical protein